MILVLLQVRHNCYGYDIIRIYILVKWTPFWNPLLDPSRPPHLNFPLYTRDHMKWTLTWTHSGPIVDPDVDPDVDP